MKELISVTLLIGISFYSVVLIPPSISISSTLADTQKNETTPNLSNYADAPTNTSMAVSDVPMMTADIPLVLEAPSGFSNIPTSEPEPKSSEPITSDPTNRTSSEPEIISAPPIFGLKDCRQTQSEDSHHTSTWWHSYALDLACIPGVSYDVPAPSFKEFYVIQYIGYDDRLGNYLILKHGDERWIYGHTQTSRKIGERVLSGDIIGQSNNSGHSLGVHSHIEKWLWKVNTTFDGKRTNEYSAKLCSQRNWQFCSSTPTIQDIVAIASPLIRKYEWLHLKAYQDVGGCSIGYGSRASSCGDTITKQEAEKRLEETVVKLAKKTMEKMPGKTAKQYSALVSLWFNCNAGYQHVMNGWEWTTSLCTKAGWQVLGWLVTRRKAELKLYY